MNQNEPMFTGFGFDLFWSIYPRKIAKRYCWKLWTRLKLTTDQEQRIIESVQLHLRTEWLDRPLSKIPHPSTFLNQARWEDELEERAESLADDIEPAELERARARDLLRLQAIWDKEYHAHQHGAKCGDGKRCAFVLEKRPR